MNKIKESIKLSPSPKNYLSKYSSDTISRGILLAVSLSERSINDACKFQEEGTVSEFIFSCSKTIPGTYNHFSQKNNSFFFDSWSAHQLVALSHNGETLISLDVWDSVKAVDLGSNKILYSFPYEQRKSKRIYYIGDHKLLVNFSVQDLRREYILALRSLSTYFSISPSGENCIRIANQIAQVWDAKTGIIKFEFSVGNTYSISSDKSLIASTSGECVNIHSILTGELLSEFPTTNIDEDHYYEDGSILVSLRHSLVFSSGRCMLNYQEETDDQEESWI
jgi:hypothetical protein